MDKLQQFLVETAYLWAATVVVVVIASAINYAITSSELNGLKNEMKVRRARNRLKTEGNDRASSASV